jgi:hypothetical protein
VASRNKYQLWAEGGRSKLKSRKREEKEDRTMKHRGGHRVGKGTYWDFDSGERIDIRDEGVLPGGDDRVYYRLPAAGILAAGPFLGLLYAAFLPFIGIAMLVKLVVQKVAGGAVSTARTSATFGWRPSESYLAGGKKGEEEKKEEGEDKGESS